MIVGASWHIYLVRCSDGSLYCGITNDLARRIETHNQGLGARYTRSRLPVTLVWAAPVKSKSDACREEMRIKRLSKQEKELLISRCRTDEEYRPVNP